MKPLYLFLLLLLLSLTLLYMIYTVYQNIEVTSMGIRYSQWADKEVFVIRNIHLVAAGIFILWFIILFIYFNYLTPIYEEGGEKG